MGLPVWRCPSPPAEEIKDAQKPSRSPIRRTAPNRYTPRRHVSVIPGGRGARVGLGRLQDLVDGGQITDPTLVSAIARNTSRVAYQSTMDAAMRAAYESWLPEEDNPPPTGSRFAASPLQMNELDLETDASSSSEDMPLANPALLPVVRQDRSHLRLPSQRPRAEGGNANLREIYLRQALERRGARSSDAVGRDQTRESGVWHGRLVPSRTGLGAEASPNPAVRSGTPRAILDRPIPSTFSESHQSTNDRPIIDGLGDRSRSPPPPHSPIYSPGSPEWAHWDTMLQTITPDEHLPTPDSSFTSAAASASFTASRSQSATSTSTSNANSAASSRTSLATDASQEATSETARPDDTTCDTDGEFPNPSTRRPHNDVLDYPIFIHTPDVADGTAPSWSPPPGSIRYSDRPRWFMRPRQALEQYRADERRTAPSERRNRPMPTLADLPTDSGDDEAISPLDPTAPYSRHPHPPSSHARWSLNQPTWSRRIPRPRLDAYDMPSARPAPPRLNVPDGPLLPYPTNTTATSTSNTATDPSPTAADSPTPVVIDAAGHLTGSDLDSLRPIMERLAARGDIPDEWWQSVGLAPVFARGVERSRARAGAEGRMANL